MSQFRSVAPSLGEGPLTRARGETRGREQGSLLVNQEATPEYATQATPLRFVIFRYNVAKSNHPIIHDKEIGFTFQPYYIIVLHGEAIIQ